MSLPTPPPAPTVSATAPRNTATTDPADPVGIIIPAAGPVVVIGGPCTHERLTREPNRICKICHRRHLFNWAYHCKGCDASACHNCRPRWAERAWVTFATVLEGKQEHD